MIPLKNLPQVHLKDYLLQQFQEDVRRALEPVLQTPILDGNWIQGVTLNGSSGSVQIPHQLGRPYNGYWITRLVSPTGTTTPFGLTVTEIYGLKVNSSIYLVLSYTGTPTSMDIWIF